MYVIFSTINFRARLSFNLRLLITPLLSPNFSVAEFTTLHATADNASNNNEFAC